MTTMSYSLVPFIDDSCFIALNEEIVAESLEVDMEVDVAETDTSDLEAESMLY